MRDMLVQDFQTTKYTSPMPTMVETTILQVSEVGESASSNGNGSTSLVIAISVAGGLMLVAALVVGALMYLWKTNRKPEAQIEAVATPHEVTMGTVGTRFACEMTTNTLINLSYAAKEDKRAQD